jgi:hypothetical protein
MQKKVLNHLTKVITSAGFEAINCRNFANTGHISIQHEDRIGELASVSYDFQSSWSTMTFSITIGNKRIPSQRGRDNYFDFYMKFTDVTDFNNFERVLRQQLEAMPQI